MSVTISKKKLAEIKKHLSKLEELFVTSSPLPEEDVSKECYKELNAILGKNYWDFGDRPDHSKGTSNVVLKTEVKGSFLHPYVDAGDDENIAITFWADKDKLVFRYESDASIHERIHKKSIIPKKGSVMATLHKYISQQD